MTNRLGRRLKTMSLRPSLRSDGSPRIDGSVCLRAEHGRLRCCPIAPREMIGELAGHPEARCTPPDRDIARPPQASCQPAWTRASISERSRHAQTVPSGLRTRTSPRASASARPDRFFRVSSHSRYESCTHAHSRGRRPTGWLPACVPATSIAPRFANTPLLWQASLV